MTALTKVLTALDEELPASLDRLLSLLRIPSISTDPTYAASCQEAAEWLVRDLQSMGFEANVRQTTGRPIVVGHDSDSDTSAPRILFYGHYDVQVRRSAESLGQ